MLTDWLDSTRTLLERNPEIAGRILHELVEADLPPVARYTVLTSARGETGAGDRGAADDPSGLPVPEMIILAGPAERPVRAIVVDFLGRRDPEARWRWPLQVSLVWLSHRCPVDLFVFCADELTAHWANRPVATTLDGYVCTPVVLVLEDHGPVLAERYLPNSCNQHTSLPQRPPRSTWMLSARTRKRPST